MNIPGLDYCPAPENPEPEHFERIISFTGSFKIPKSQICGNCRNINEFEKLACLKVSSSWVYRKCQDYRKNEIVCIKQIKKDESSEVNVPKDVNPVRREIEILYQLGHENIMQFYEPVVGDSFEKTYLVFECCEYFLSDLMNQRISALFGREVIKKIFHQVITALDYLHKKLIMHRDIHPKNLMFNQYGILKVANFGNARYFCSEDLELDSTFLSYQAPELLLEAEKHGPAVDIWAAGCLLCELFLVENIFPGNSTELVLQNITCILGVPSDAIWPEYSKLPGLRKYEITDAHYFNCLDLYFKRNSPQTSHSIMLLRDMFIYYPKVRIPANEILEHPYFTESPAPASILDISNILQGADVVPGMMGLRVA